MSATAETGKMAASAARTLYVRTLDRDDRVWVM
jgi:hypothetical protein